MNQPQNSWSLPFRYVSGLLLLAGFIAFTIYARDAVRALVIAGFISYLINPAVIFLTQRTKLSRAAAVNIVYFSSLILMVGIPATLTPIFFDELKFVVRDVLDLNEQFSATLSQPLTFGGMEFHLERLASTFAHLQDVVLSPLPEQVFAWLETTSVGVLWVLIILVSIYIFMTEWPRMRDWLIDLTPPPYQADMQELYRRVRRIWMAYLRGQIVLMLIVGVVFTIAWLILGIPGALVLGVVAGLFTLVPDVGPFLAAVIAIAVALLEGSNWIDLPNIGVAGIVLLVYLVLINLKNFFLRPIVMGRSVHMNEALVFIAIMIATILEGIMGALLVVPVLASVMVVVEYLRRRVLDLPAFADDGEKQFVAPAQEVSRKRSFGRKSSKKQEESS